MFTLIHTNWFWVKILHVKGRTSLQSHERRTEYHISIMGVRRVHPKERHRMESGVYIEFAYGDPYEEDVIRFEDDYGRV